MAEHTPKLPDQARQLARGELVHAEVKPLDMSGVPTVAIGTGAWALAFGVLMLFFRDDLERHDAEWWLWVPATGAGLGLVGLVYCRRRWNAIQRDRQSSGSTGSTS